MSSRAPDDESWRRSTLITHHRDHPPQGKALVDELYAALSENGRRDYETMIAVPTRDSETMRLTHLVYGGCTAHQIRQDLVARGLGSLAITWVYPPETDLLDDN